jgi:hypothetical protein
MMKKQVDKHLRRLAFGNRPHIIEGVDVFRALVLAQADDAREAQGVAALVAGAGLYPVERHLYY